VFVGVDHGPLPNEAIESTVYLSNLPNRPWTQCVVDRVYLEGWQVGYNWDRFTYVVKPQGNISTTFRFLSINNCGPGALQKDRDNKINKLWVLIQII